MNFLKSISWFGGGDTVRYGGARRLALLVTFIGLLPALVILIIEANNRLRPAPTAWSTVFVCVAAGLIALVLLGRLLRPIGLVSKAMDDLMASVAPDEPPRASRGELATILHNAERLALRFRGLNKRLLNQHPGTGLPTREPFLLDLAQDMERQPEPTVLALIRLCDFDRMAGFDRAAAELTLSAFAARLGGAARSSLSLAQVDRDCFAIWFRATPVGTASDELRALSYVLEQDLTIGGQKISPLVAVGAAIYPSDAVEPAALLACAFAATPKTASATKSATTTFFSSTATESERKRFAMEQNLRKAISEEQFILYYQPIVDLACGRAVGAEALLRWRHPELGLVSPGEFIPILEQSGLIDQVGMWVLNTACREARSWRLKGVEDMRVAVNLSARQFRGPSLGTTVVRMLDRHRLAPHDLELELTETAAMQDAERTREVLGQLRSLGVGVAIDDFGAGYSSLSYLKNLPFTKLKIDREFVVDVHERPDSQAICGALATLAGGLGIELLAEGVEKREEVDALLALGCVKFQGYYFGRPMPAADFIETVTDGSWLDKLLRAAPAPAAKRRRA